MAKLFEDWELVSGLALNIHKSALVLLFPTELRTRLSDTLPRWSTLGIASHAKYLGFFFLGPGRGNSCWDAVLAKYKARAQAWGRLGVGIFSRCDADRSYDASMTMFCAQLDPNPSPGVRRLRTAGHPRHVSWTDRLDVPPSPPSLARSPPLGCRWICVTFERPPERPSFGCTSSRVDGAEAFKSGVAQTGSRWCVSAPFI